MLLCRRIRTHRTQSAGHVAHKVQGAQPTSGVFGLPPLALVVEGHHRCRRELQLIVCELFIIVRLRASFVRLVPRDCSRDFLRDFLCD